MTSPTPVLYAVLQRELNPPSVDLLRRAFRSVSFLTDLDAHMLAQDAYGILVRRLGLDNATKLQLVLRHEGLETDIVPEPVLPSLPPSKQVHRLDCTAPALLIYDPVGRSFPLEWANIDMIAAGKVRTNESRIVESRNHWGSNDRGSIDWVSDTRRREERIDRLLLEVVVRGAVLRYSASAEKFTFAYLGDRVLKTPEENFVLLVRDLVSYAPQAVLNRGAYYLREAATEPTSYPSKNAFYEEIVWLLWKMKKGQ
jgi:hypothetical protein